MPTLRIQEGVSLHRSRRGGYDHSLFPGKGSMKRDHTQDDLATLVIKHVIFHDVPQKISDGGAKPQLSDVETK